MSIEFKYYKPVKYNTDLLQGIATINTTKAKNTSALSS